MATEYISHMVDAAHMRNIGEQSISNKIQAVLELVKNAYDGDALECIVKFHGEKLDNGNIKITKISVEDSGIGMTKNDIKNKLMKVGTPNKIEETYSPKLKRRVSGAKGMGHYSMQRLGTKTIISTTPEPYEGREFFNYDNSTYVLEINWNDYISGKDFQSITHRLSAQKKENGFGTKIEITGLRDNWNISEKNSDIKLLAKNIGYIMLPKVLEVNKENIFKPTIEGVGFEIEKQNLDGGLLNNAPYKIEARLRGNKLFLRTFKKKKNPSQNFIEISSKTKSVDAKCGNANFVLYWFYSKNQKWSDGIFQPREFENQLRENYGIKIYNDNVRVMPFGEKGNDWVGLDTRKSGGGSGGMVRNSKLIGLIELSREKNPNIVETTSREAIKKNVEFQSLRDDFVMPTIEELEGQVKIQVEEEKQYEKKTRPGNIAQAQINHVKDKIEKIDFSPDDKKSISTYLTKAYKQIEEQKQQYEKNEDDLTSNIEMYRNLATVGIQTIAFNHEIIDPVRFVKGSLTNLNQFYDKLDDEKKKKYLLRSLERITHTLNWANRIKEFSSIMAGTDITKKKKSAISIEETIMGIKNSSSVIFDTLDITMHNSTIDGNIPNVIMNKASFESIFINLISNSVRALKKIRGRKREIKIKVWKDSSHVKIQFWDNGCGISYNNVDDIFKPFFTTYKSPSDVGTGMGLTIVRDIVETDYKGTITLKNTVYEKDSVGNGMTMFLIKLPLIEVVGK